MKILLNLAFLTTMMASSILAQFPIPAPNAPRPDWPIFPAGKQPPGKIVSDADVFHLPPDAERKQVLYLVGTFVVTASGAERAILRSSGHGTGEGRLRIRLIVSYPPSIPAPRENAVVIRDNSQGFLITNIRRAPDGEINVSCRDITAP